MYSTCYIVVIVTCILYISDNCTWNEDQINIYQYNISLLEDGHYDWNSFDGKSFMKTYLFINNKFNERALQ